MSLIKLQGNASGTGAFTIAAPNGNTDRTLTLPDATGTVVTADASGNVGIGTTSIPSGRRLAVSGGSVRLDTDYQIEWGGSTVGLYGHGANNTLHFFTNTTERARIDASGNLLVGTTTNPNTAKIHIGPTASNGISIESNSTSVVMSQMLFRNPNGIVGSITTSGSSTAYNTSSDYRLKEDWQPMAGASERVLALKPVNFAWKVDGSRVDGFLAHEAQEVVPEAVTGAKDEVDDEGNPKYQGIDQSKLVPLLTAALQEALAEIANLKTRLTALEAN